MITRASSYLRKAALADLNRSGWNLTRGVRAGLGCSVPLLLSEWLDQPSWSWAALIGFFIVLVDPGWPGRVRVYSIVAFSAVTAVGCGVAVLVRTDVVAATLLALMWCFAAVMIRVWGAAAASSGTLSAIAVLIALGTSGTSSMHAAWQITAMTVVGGLWGLVLAFAIGRNRASALPRSATAAVFEAQSEFVRDLAEASSNLRRGAVRDAVEAARTTLNASRRLTDTALAARLSLAVSDADRGLASLLALRELLEGAPRDQRPVAELRILAAALDEMAAAIRSDAKPPLPVRSAIPVGNDAVTRAVRNTAMSIDAAAAHCFAPQPESADQELMRGTPRRLLGELLDNLAPASLALRHAARFAVVGAALTLLDVSLGLDYGYWITLTAVIILQTYPSATWLRAVQRVTGSVIGGVVAAVASLALHTPAEMTLVIVPLSIVAMAFRFASYLVYIACITPLFILITGLFSQAGEASAALVGTRVVDNLVGASVGLLATFLLWPSWEGSYLRYHLARAVRANGEFLAVVLEGGASERDLLQARRAAGLAGNNAEASLRRALEEPRRYPGPDILAAESMIGAARRLATIAASISQTADCDSDAASVGDDVRRRTDELAAAIEHARVPSTTPGLLAERPPSGLSEPMSRVTHQLANLEDAARTLAKS